MVKNLPAMQETRRSTEEGNGSIAEKISWTEEPGGLQSVRLQKAGHD